MLDLLTRSFTPCNLGIRVRYIAFGFTIKDPKDLTLL